MSTSDARLTCLCGAVSEPGSLLVAAKFPIKTGMCNCDGCRHSVGTMGCSPLPLKASPSDKSVAACSTYDANKTMTRYFCSTCGTKIFFYSRRGGSPVWVALPGVIERSDFENVDTIFVNQTWYVADTKDGGLAGKIFENMLIGAAGSPPKDKFFFYAGDRTEGPRIPFDQVKSLWTKSVNNPNLSEDDKIAASCHCGSVQIQVCRPSPARNSSKELKRYSRQNNTKYTAGLCTCRSCRLATGLPLQPWSFIMPRNILTKSGEQVEFSSENGLKNLSGLTTYRSSKNVRRSFCKKCGATFFFERTDRPEVVAISMGLFSSPVGAMATDFFEWRWDIVGHREECRVQDYLQMFVGPREQRLSKV